jgi:hypothetical protein
MKRFAFLFIIFSISSTNIVLAQNNWYTIQFQKVDSLLNEGLSREAFAVFDSIYIKALQEGNEDALIKSVLGRNQSISETDEEPLIKIIEQLKTDVITVKPPLNEIIHSLIAEIYWNYYQQNRWQISQRTPLNQSQEEDNISTWDLSRLVSEMFSHLLLSLNNAKNLQTIPAKNYSSFLIGDTSLRYLRPTLYDLLAHRALKLLENPEIGLVKPLNVFTLNNEVFFKLAPDFSKFPISTSDTLSILQKAVSIYQDLTKFRLSEGNNEALTELELNRIRFISIHSNHPFNDSLSVRFYEELMQNSVTNESKAEVAYWLAFHHYSQQENGQDNRLRLSNQLCDLVLQQYSDTRAAKFCKELKAKIEERILVISTEQVELPSIPFRALINWKNLNDCYLRIYKIDSRNFISYRLMHDFDFKKLENEKLIRQWKQDLPEFDPYLSHKAEISIQGLPSGFYIILASNEENPTAESLKSAVLVQISSLSVIRRNMPKGSIFALVNATTGKPIKGATLQFFSSEYNWNSRDRKYEKIAQLSTNSLGEAQYISDKGANLRIIANYKGDSLIINERYYSNYNYQSVYNNREKQVSFFTDRSIYRPGQTIYFKGLVLEQKDEKWNISERFKTTVSLRNPNYELISSLSLLSNEYGTFSGSFTLPSSGLNGQYVLESPSGVYYFRVEEYRRPNFEVSFIKPDRSFSFGDSVSVTGEVMTFAGVPVADAIVKYTVTRREDFFRWWMPQVPDKIIINGEHRADNSGRFVINFNALSDDLSNFDRVMAYEISVDATDINGETQTNKFTVRISNNNVFISCNIPEVVHSTSLKEVEIVAKNLDGDEINSEVKVTVTKLITPGVLFSNRYWETPDTFVLDEISFRKNFPTLPYKDEHQSKNWKIGKEVLTLSVQLPLKEKFNFDSFLDSEPGYYQILIEARNENGEVISTWEKRVRLITNIPLKAEKTDDWVTVIKSGGEPGEVAEFWLTALHIESPIRFELVKGDQLLKSELLKPGKQVLKVLVPIEEGHRGNIMAQFTQIANNRKYSKNVEIIVPYSDRLIDVKFTTFRNMLLPGEKEEWGLTLTDRTGKGLTAEMVATLYDSSLDKFVRHNWPVSFDIQRYNNRFTWDINLLGNMASPLHIFWNNGQTMPYWNKEYEFLKLMTFNIFNRYSSGIRIRGLAANKNMAVVSAESLEMIPAIADRNVQFDEADMDFADEIIPVTRMEEAEETIDFSQVAVRSNFNETAFFYPSLYSNDEGKLSISFTIPEAITKWKMMGFAHTKDFKHGNITNELITRKLLSVSAYFPRFLRESDTLDIAAKVSNITDTELSGDALLQLTNAVTLEPVTAMLVRGDSLVKFLLPAKSNTMVKWRVIVPKGLQALTYKVLAATETHSDGEQKTIPVLTNRQLVTESMPFMVRGNQKIEMKFDKMANHKSTTLTNHRFAIEYTSNPAWYAIQSLPYLMEYPYECAEQVFSRFYANAAASSLVNSSPKIKAVFDTWKLYDSGAFLSNLEKNSELKSILIEEAPWLLSAKNESEAKKRVGLLFDLNRMGNELDAALKKLQQMQLPNGGFPWFTGMPDNRYITQHITMGLGEMMKLKIIDPRWKSAVDMLYSSTLQYLDERIIEDYNELKKQSEKDSLLLEKYKPSMLQVHYLYSKSFSDTQVTEGQLKEVNAYFLKQTKKHWLTYDVYAQALIALIYYRNGDVNMAERVIKSLADRAIRSTTEGMYWRENRLGYFWYESPIETHSLLMGAFSEINADTTLVEEMKIWLLRNKQTTHWKTTKATLSACYALLSQGNNLLDDSQLLKVSLAGKPIETYTEIKPEAGTGYVKVNFSADEIKPGMEKISVENNNRGIAWGAAYWQYFEQLDKITQAKTDVEIKKQFFIKKQSDRGAILEPVTSNTPVKVGDEVIIRLVIKSLRDLEYVHLKDLRASGFEPLSVISGYRWQDGLGYYQEVKDAAMNFFIGYLRKGTYVFEYSLRATHQGSFSNGLSTLQCMYAPEFTTQSQGGRIGIEK